MLVFFIQPKTYLSSYYMCMSPPCWHSGLFLSRSLFCSVLQALLTFSFLFLTICERYRVKLKAGIKKEVQIFPPPPLLPVERPVLDSTRHPSRQHLLWLQLLSDSGLPSSTVSPVLEEMAASVTDLGGRGERGVASMLPIWLSSFSIILLNQLSVLTPIC